MVKCESFIACKPIAGVLQNMDELEGQMDFLMLKNQVSKNNLITKGPSGWH